MTTFVTAAVLPKGVKAKLLLLFMLIAGTIYLFLYAPSVGSIWTFSRSVVFLRLVIKEAEITASVPLGDALKVVPQPTRLSPCPATPPDLVGLIPVVMKALHLTELEKLYPRLEPGGYGQPSTCRTLHAVAIIVPFRDRNEHLRVFLRHMHSFLAKQQIAYTIFIVEQVAGETFNRGKLMNVGFVEAQKMCNWSCFIFHDVDLLPEDDRNLYTCADQPKHLSVAIDKFQYRGRGDFAFGGVTAMTKEQMAKMNGYSNDFWGWGGEDTDMYERLTLAGYNVSRFPAEIGRYKMIKHDRDRGNPVNKCRFELLGETKRRWRIDGLSNLNYTRVEFTRQHLYMNVTVKLYEKESIEWLKKQPFAKKC
ncbi:hypothetical protein QR680_011162 [Steinernema hermaphroditum]|uniref:Beta-1,4-N-acetylgalactosaminyltransferase n=1 Tax=Steinernema hermaphroditum TaxID=289476 RepID=A0AA39IRE0_9BILA|nr:hypothetical protein QR680_011162 [Steinernema hermaphroditum]